MIEGITILNQTEIMVQPDWCYRWGGIWLILFVISLYMLFNNRDFPVWLCGMSAIIAIISFAWIVVIINWRETEPTGRYKYEVTIDESVDFIDIYKNYDVIEQRGQIWVLEDKEN